MASKNCVKCQKVFSGFGDACSTCRKAGLKSQGTAKACAGCGAFFSGFGDVCDACGKASTAKIAQKAWDEDGLPLDETNVDGIGSDEDKALRKGAAGTEPAWQGIGNEPGLWIFRIESFKVIAWPKAKYGQFHTGDSYICLNVQKDINPETKEETDKLDRNIHFWLGKETSTDEKGTAAYKTVELDDFFDGDASQFREVQGIESEEFNSLFPDGISYLEGGVESGFKVTQVDIFVNKLYQVRKNAKKKIIIEEEAVALKSLNHRDAWILDAGRKIYIWSGDNASPFLKNAANAKAEKMESERDGESTATHEIDDAFWEALGGKGDITPADQVGEEVEANFGEGVLFNVHVNAQRELKITEAGRGDLKKSMLNHDDVMLLDTRTEIFVWLGKGASEVEKRSAMKTATNYLKMNGRSVDKTAVTILKDGHDHKNKVWAQVFAD